MKWAGTMLLVVTRSAAMRRTHASGSKRDMTTTVAPTKRCCDAYALNMV